jgi:hypothetical protein
MFLDKFRVVHLKLILKQCVAVPQIINEKAHGCFFVCANSKKLIDTSLAVEFFVRRSCMLLFFKRSSMLYEKTNTFFVDAYATNAHTIKWTNSCMDGQSFSGKASGHTIVQTTLIKVS